MQGLLRVCREKESSLVKVHGNSERASKKRGRRRKKPVFDMLGVSGGKLGKGGVFTEGAIVMGGGGGVQKKLGKATRSLLDDQGGRLEP